MLAFSAHGCCFTSYNTSIQIELPECPSGKPITPLIWCSISVRQLQSFLIFTSYNTPIQIGFPECSSGKPITPVIGCSISVRQLQCFLKILIFFSSIFNRQRRESILCLAFLIFLFGTLYRSYRWILMKGNTNQAKCTAYEYTARIHWFDMARWWENGSREKMKINHGKFILHRFEFPHLSKLNYPVRGFSNLLELAPNLLRTQNHLD